MTPYWVVVNRTTGTPAFSGLGIDVTARSEDDARRIVHAQFGPATTIYEIKPILDMSELEQNHVAPNIEPNWIIRGAWFLRGFREISN